MPTGRGGVRSAGDSTGRGRYASGIGRDGGSPGVDEPLVMYSEFAEYWQRFLELGWVWGSLLVLFILYRVTRFLDGAG